MSISESKVLPPLVSLFSTHSDDLFGILWCWGEDCRHLDVDVSLLRPFLLQLLAGENVEVDPGLGAEELLIVDGYVIMSVWPVDEELPLIVLVEEQHLLLTTHDISNYDAD